MADSSPKPTAAPRAREHRIRVEVALETSTRRPSLAVRRGAQLRERRLAPERSHASDLVPALDALLRELGAEPRDIAAVFAGTGPGSYTGLRVGIALALGLARGSGAALRGVPSGEALCFGELSPGEECVVLLDARQGGIYFARYRRLDAEVLAVEAPSFVAAAELPGRIPPGSVVFAESGAATAAGLPLDAGAAAGWRSGHTPSAAALLELGAQRLAALGSQRPEELEPLYLRAFQAVPRRREGSPAPPRSEG